MINKYFKLIHTKYSKFFKFIFLIRYLFVIFIISFALFLIIPNFFNYEKKADVIQNKIFKNYNLQIQEYEEIKFRTILFPHLELKNTVIFSDNFPTKLKIKKLKIYPKNFNIYNLNRLQINKLILEDSSLVLEAKNLKSFINKFLQQNNKFYLNNLDLKIVNKDKTLIKFENTNYLNYGYEKNFIKSRVFGKKFKVKINEDFKKLNFKFPDSGLTAELNLNKHKNDFIGIFKAKILNSNLKFNFNYENDVIKIYNSYFRNKNLSFKNKSTITLKPFIDSQSIFEIENVKKEIFNNIDFKNLLQRKDLLKKINSKNEIDFTNMKFNKSLIDNLNLKIDLAYGRMNFLKKSSISDSIFLCKGDVNFLEEYPILFFDCSILSKNKKDFLKKFAIKTKDSNNNFSLKVTGNLNILNKKINFTKILLNQDYKATREDLKYFKRIFENIILDESFIEIFNLKKIKKFVLEIS